MIRKSILIFAFFGILAATAIGFFTLGYLTSESNQKYIQEHPDVLGTPPELNSEKLWETVNNWRASQNLSKYIKSDKLCDFAKIRLDEIKTDWSHVGFEPLISKYFNKNESYEIGENLADVASEQDAISSWLNSPSHKKNLVQDYKYSCIETNGSFAVQIFANF